MSFKDSRPCVVHIVHRFDTGGLENGVANLINNMPAYRHVVLAITDIGAFKARVQAPGTSFFALHKPPGQGLWLYAKVFRLLREWRPQVVHTRNLGTMEFGVPAWAARVPLRLHGEHGYDVSDLTGTSGRHQRLRRLYAPFISGFVALSKDLSRYLVDRVGIRAADVHQIYNGVDTDRFAPPAAGDAPPKDWPFVPGTHIVIGAVGRLHPVKDPINLVKAFIALLQAQPAGRATLRLALIGDGVQRDEALRLLRTAACDDLAWLPGDRDDVPALLRWVDVYCQPSLAEGISNTVLEAMASARPVVATAVGGTPELLQHGQTGLLVPPADSAALAACLGQLVADSALRARLGAAARAHVLACFSLERMVASYQSLYDGAVRR